MRVLIWTRRALAACGAAVVIVMFSPLVYWWTAALRGEWSDGAGDTLIVLAADLVTEEENGRAATLGQGTLLRCVYASWAWKQHAYRRVVVSGARGAAAAMRTFLIALQVPAEIILTEPRADSTRENALFIRGLLGADAGRVVLLSSDYHMRRAGAAFARAGLAVKPLPCPDIAKRANGAWFWRWEAARLLGMETLQLMSYSGKGWV